MTIENHVTLIGNLTRDFEVRFTPSGKAVANSSLAVNRRWRNRDGEYEEVTSFFDLVVWDQLGQNAADSLTKGTRVFVQGRLDQRTWDSDNGKRSKIEVVVDEIGPSLKWATAQVTRQSRDSSGNDTAPVAPAPAAPAPGPDEEPF